MAHIARFLVFLLVLETVFVIHEYGHLVELQQRDVPIEEFSLGIGWLIYQWPTETFQISFRAIPIMAYVMPTEDGVQHIENSFTFWEKFVAFSAGSRNNFGAALAIVFFFQILGWTRGYLTISELVKTIAITPFRMFMRCCALVVDCLSFGYVRVARKFLLSTGWIYPPRWVVTFVRLSILIGILNMMPILPLDGGKIASAAFPGLSELPSILIWIIFFAFIFLINVSEIEIEVLEVEV